MADKSPRQHMQKKAGKSIKEKRLDKKSKNSTSSSSEMPSTKKN